MALPSASWRGQVPLAALRLAPEYSGGAAAPQQAPRYSLGKTRPAAERYGRCLRCCIRLRALAMRFLGVFGRF